MQMENYTAGFAKLDITPPLGVAMIGAGPRQTKGVIDPLFVRAVAFGHGEKSAVLLSCDLLGMYGKFGHEWPLQIEEKLGLEKGSLIVHCTHTHTGPSPTSDKMYADWLFRRLCDAATMALDDRKPVTDVCWAEGQTPEGTAYVRRYVMRDGTITTHPKAGDTGNPDIIRHVSPGDLSMRVIRILRQEGAEIDLVNFQMHPDNVGGEYCSADYPGVLCNIVEDRRKGVNCVFLDGAEGQMVGGTKLKPFVHKSIEKATGYAQPLAATALSLLEQTASTGMAGLGFGRVSIPLNARPEGKKYDEEFTPETRLFNVSAITFCGLALVGMSGEPYYEMGTHVRGYSVFPATCICCQSNGADGYLPMAADYGHPGGSYEPRITRNLKGSAEEVVFAAEELLRSLIDTCEVEK